MLEKIDFSELETPPIIEKDNLAVTVLDGELEEALDIINEEILVNGMDDEDTVNDYGKELYELYDEMIDQKYS